MPILSDSWAGLDNFFTPGSEIFVAENSDDAVEAIAMDDATLWTVAAVARERTLAEHTAARRAAELESMLAGVAAETVER